MHYDFQTKIVLTTGSITRIFTIEAEGLRDALNKLRVAVDNIYYVYYGRPQINWSELTEEQLNKGNRELGYYRIDAFLPDNSNGFLVAIDANTIDELNSKTGLNFELKDNSIVATASHGQLHAFFERYKHVFAKTVEHDPFFNVKALTLKADPRSYCD